MPRSTSSSAAAVARSTRLAERDGIRSHRLIYAPVYAEHVVCGRVDGRARPMVERTRPSAIGVDAATGFAHPAIEAGLLGLCFTNAPASIAPVGGNAPVIGTNPFALGVPGAGGEAALVIAQLASVVAKSEIVLRARKGEPLEPGWALDAGGAPTTDPATALKGSMAPADGDKGFGIGLVVELFAACLSGATLGRDASPFSGAAGGPPRTGRCFLALDPAGFSGAAFQERTGSLRAAIGAQEGARLPGMRRRANRARIEAEGVAADADLVDRIKGFAAPHPSRPQKPVNLPAQTRPFTGTRTAAGPAGTRSPRARAASCQMSPTNARLPTPAAAASAKERS